MRRDFIQASHQVQTIRRYGGAHNPAPPAA
ncbi:hypothetical protein [Streptomyces violascens]